MLGSRNPANVFAIIVPRTVLNTIANGLGLGANATFGVLFTAIYFRLLGGEHYGLVGFCLTLLLASDFFAAMGLGRATVRELARREHSASLAQEMRDALLTLQLIHVGLALVCGLVLIIASGWIAEHWLRRDEVSLEQARTSILLLGVLVACQLPREICRAALTGLQRQVLVNMLGASFVLVRGIFTIVALTTFGRDAIVFLSAQIFVSIVETLWFVVAAWRRMPPGSRQPRFDPKIVKETWAFATTDGLVMMASAAMMLGDQLILSTILPLDLYGGYVLVIRITDVIARGALPFTYAFFPHLTDLVARGRHEELAHDYHRVSQVASSILIPFAFLVGLFPAEILRLISGDASITAALASVLVLRTFGNLFASLQYLPQVLQLSMGATLPVLIITLIVAPIYLIGTMMLTPIYGVIVPAALWCGLHAATIFPMLIITHRMILHGQAWVWTKKALIAPTLISVCVVTLGRLTSPATISWTSTTLWLAATGLLTTLAILWASPDLRALAGAGIRKLTLRRQVRRRAD